MDKVELFSKNWNLSITDDDFCSKLDDLDSLSSLRAEFLIPEESESSDSNKKHQVIYLCGNSLGLQPRGIKDYINSHLDKWAQLGVDGHFTEPNAWLTIDDIVQKSMASIVGSLPSEIAIMNSLTCNLHLMMISFYQPNQERYKIIIEKKSFPSDNYAVVSQIIFHGLDPNKALIELSPREGEIILRTEDILEVIEREGDSVSIVLLSGVQYYTGQFFDLERITATSQSKGCYVGFDLAHAVGNVPLELHQWGCDFACWCSYKYLNSGPGAIGGCFVHDKHCHPNMKTNSKMTDNIIDDTAKGESSATGYLRRLAGWWGNRLEDRFQMNPDFIPCDGAYGFRLSNPSVLLIACLRASLDIFDKTSMAALREKSLLLTGYLEKLIQLQLDEYITIFTPSDPVARGCQLSLSFKSGGVGVGIDVEMIQTALRVRGVVCDVRKPDVMRIAPVPLYNSFRDIYQFVTILKDILINIR